MPIDVYMSMSIVEVTMDTDIDIDSEKTINLPLSATYQLRNDWFDYECDVSDKKKTKSWIKRKHKVTKRNKHSHENDSKNFPGDLIFSFCGDCNIHHGKKEQCFTDYYDNDDDDNDNYYWDYPQQGIVYGGCCCY